MNGITNSDGKALDLDVIKPTLLGYQIEHKITTRLFPSTQRFEIYTLNAANNKMLTVIDFMEREHKTFIDQDDYKLVPVYDTDIESFHIIMDEKDWENIMNNRINNLN